MSEKHGCNVGDSISVENASWTFEGDVVRTFTEHVRKSVPLYEEGQQIISELSDYFIKDNSICYDIGTSTGSILKKLILRHENKDVRWVGIDIVDDMISQARKECCEAGIPEDKVELVCADVIDYELEKADFIVCYYTVQFISPRFRQEFINKVYNALNWGGAFLLFEKVRAPDARFQDIATSVYNEYKLNIGYQPEEIVSKTRSLKGVLEPFSTQGNLDLLRRAGFVDIMTVMKYVNFEGFFAIK